MRALLRDFKTVLNACVSFVLKCNKKRNCFDSEIVKENDIPKKEKVKKLILIIHLMIPSKSMKLIVTI